MGRVLSLALLSLTVVLGVSASPSSAVAEDGYAMDIGGASAQPTDDFAIPIDGLWAAEVMGYTVVVQFPPLPPVTGPDIVVDATISGEIGPEFVLANVDPVAGTAVLGVLFEIVPPFTLVLEPLGFPIAIAEIVGTVPDGTPPQTIPFDLVDGIGSPPQDNIFVVDNQSVSPATLDGGELVIEEADPEPNLFIRGDVNMDGSVSLADVIFHLVWAFQGGPAPLCEDAADANDDGNADITDGIFVLDYLFLDGQTPWPPFPSPGPDYTPDDIGCEESPF